MSENYDRIAEICNELECLAAELGQLMYTVDDASGSWVAGAQGEALQAAQSLYNVEEPDDEDADSR